MYMSFVWHLACGGLQNPLLSYEVTHLRYWEVVLLTTTLYILLQIETPVLKRFLHLSAQHILMCLIIDFRLYV